MRGALLEFLHSPSKARHTGFQGLSFWLDRDVGGNWAIRVENCKLFSIVTAPKIESFE